MAATKTKRKNSTASFKAQHRAAKGKDHTPKWQGCEDWDTDQYLRHFKDAMDWYRLEKSSRDLKPEVITWMSINGYTQDQIKAFKNTKDHRCNATMGSIAANLNRGMLPVRPDFNNGKNTAVWLGTAIAEAMEYGRNDVVAEEVVEKNTAPVVSIQDRLHEASYAMTEEIEDALAEFHKDHESFNPKAFKILNLLKGKQAKAAHARIIRGLYTGQLAEYQEVLQGDCPQLKEGYAHIAKKNVKKIIEFYQEITSACEMLMQEQKVNRKPRVKKAQPKDKVVAKLKFMKTHEPLKLVSIDPTGIVGSKELWVFNTKTRKLGKYVASEYQELGVKGTSITGFDENLSVQKTLRKPDDQLKSFKTAGKVTMRKFMEDIRSVEIKLTGRINEETVLLKVC
jgi:hypothetical protein